MQCREEKLVYRIVPWNRRLLARHHKQPAGPLFDIKCLQQSVCRLHLPHCEIRSTGGGEFLSVAHVNDEGIEFIGPQKITETHVVINITGFSGFGNVKDEDSPAEPVRALVLLFYRPPADPDAESLLNVLLLPRNVVLRDVLRTRKKLVGDESYIETSPHCKLQPKQEYTLSTCPAEDSVLVQPTEAEFDCDNYDNYFPSFQVILETMRKHVKLFFQQFCFLYIYVNLFIKPMPFLLTSHFIRYTLLVPGWTLFCLQKCLNSSWHTFNKVLEDFGPC
ncbi:uncharacterized protein LOC119885146 [Micropterus salmoides]|uniref:uncharacterized protein LOC119885146 n=1 Tax=Micropterus salmoides TaxID=27706 RepID=UPI0018ECC516|nr:uncharacterized protein LOC119885146 [Micropterus salmoides]